MRRGASNHAPNICLVVAVLLTLTHRALLDTTNDESGWEDKIEGFDLPGVQHEMRLEIGGGQTECFYQRLQKGADLHVSFEARHPRSTLSIAFLRRGNRSDNRRLVCRPVWWLAS